MTEILDQRVVVVVFCCQVQVQFAAALLVSVGLLARFDSPVGLFFSFSDHEYSDISQLH